MATFNVSAEMKWVVVVKEKGRNFPIDYRWCKTEKEGEKLLKEEKEKYKKYLNTRIEDYEITLHPWSNQ